MNPTVDELRRQLGSRQNWFGDLDARETRTLYHKLLPTDLLLDDSEIPVDERARLAVAARRAARLYARERSLLPVTIGCQLLDGVRVFLDQGRFQSDGLSEEQIFEKYIAKLGYTASHLDEDFFYHVLEKSCTVNEHVDKIVFGSG